MSADIIGFPEPIVLLSRKRDALFASMDACHGRGEGDLAERASEQAVKVEDQIAAMVPTSIAGAIAQFRVLCDLARDFEWDDWADEIAGNLIAGLERIGRPGR
jgi:hypothetical protein